MADPIVNCANADENSKLAISTNLFYRFHIIFFSFLKKVYKHARCYEKFLIQN